MLQNVCCAALLVVTLGCTYTSARPDEMFSSRVIELGNQITSPGATQNQVANHRQNKLKQRGDTECDEMSPVVRSGASYESPIGSPDELLSFAGLKKKQACEKKHDEFLQRKFASQGSSSLQSSQLSIKRQLAEQSEQDAQAKAELTASHAKAKAGYELLHAKEGWQWKAGERNMAAQVQLSDAKAKAEKQMHEAKAAAIARKGLKLQNTVKRWFKAREAARTLQLKAFKEAEAEYGQGVANAVKLRNQQVTQAELEQVQMDAKAARKLKRAETKRNGLKEALKKAHSKLSAAQALTAPNVEALDKQERTYRKQFLQADKACRELRMECVNTQKESAQDAKVEIKAAQALFRKTVASLTRAKRKKNRKAEQVKQVALQKATAVRQNEVGRLVTKAATTVRAATRHSDEVLEKASIERQNSIEKTARQVKKRFAQAENRKNGAQKKATKDRMLAKAAAALRKQAVFNFKAKAPANNPP